VSTLYKSDEYRKQNSGLALAAISFFFFFFLSSLSLDFYALACNISNHAPNFFFVFNLVPDLLVNICFIWNNL